MTEDSSKGETITTDFVAVRKIGAVRPEDDAKFIRLIARNHYIVSRVSLVCGYSISGCLLAHQSLEMYLKGIIRAHGGRQKGHELTKLLGYGAGRLKIAGLGEMSKNQDQMTLLRQLYDVYKSLRFGEDSGFFIENKNIILYLDEIALSFEKMYSERFGETRKPRIYVHEAIRNRFLKLNDFFTAEMVSNNSELNGPATDREVIELPSEVGQRIFTVSSMQAKVVTGPIAFTHVPKRIPKDEQKKA